MKVCLVRPPILTGKLAFMSVLTPPLGPAYVAAALRASGHHVSMVDAVGEDPVQVNPVNQDYILQGLSFDQIVRRIPPDSDVIGISCMFSSEWVQVRELIRKIARNHKNAFIIGGGEHFTATAEFCLQQCPEINAIVLGEGEETAVELVNSLEQQISLNSVDGLVLQCETGIIKTRPRQRIKSIDNVVKPAWDLVNIDNYFKNNLYFGVNRGRSMPLLASRGCPYHCTFCSNPAMWQPKWYARTPQMVIDEIQE